MVANSPLLLTLGYGKRSIDEVIGLLKAHEVKYLIDVRSVPWSKYHPDFVRGALQRHLAAHDVVYLFLGEELGGRPDDAGCYDESGQVNYGACRLRPAFREGIGRLGLAWNQGQRVALLCSESRPEDCHRFKLIGAVLEEEVEGIAVTHLDEDGAPLSQQQVMSRLTGGQLGLFDEFPPLEATKSRGRYRAVEE